MVRSLLSLLFASLFLVLGLGGCPAILDAVSPPTAKVSDGADPRPGPANPAARPVSSKPVGEIVAGDAMKVPYLLWGGDMATFHGNGGVRTRKGTAFDQRGLVLELFDGNDFDTQVAAYQAGSGHFLRGTFRMIGLAAERVTKTPDDTPVVFLQMTWSAGDHLVASPGIKTIDALKGKRIAVQKGGPHVGLLDDVLRTGGLGWSDVTVVWVTSITGPGSAAELFRKGGADAAFAITPDMLGLTGGLEATGTGAEGTVQGARVLVSTAELSHAVADVYAVRKSFYDKNPELVARFASAYLQSVEEVVTLKRAYEAAGSEDYLALLQLSQDIFGAEAIPTLDEDAHGLLSDCTFVGHPGNVAFFTDPKLVYGFADFNHRTQELAVSQGFSKRRAPLLPSPLAWDSPTVLQGLTMVAGKRGQRFDGEALLSEVESLDADGVLDNRTLLSFTIAFQPNQTEFDPRVYKKKYDRLFELAARFGNAAVVIRGHSDTTLVLRDAVQAGLANGGLKRSGTPGQYKYFLDGRPLDIDDQKQMMEVIAKSDAFRPSGGVDPRRTMQAALNLSRDRAQAVRQSVLKDAAARGIRIDESQIQAQGVGIREPLVARPRGPDEAALNMRVEFRLVRVSAEAMTASDFDF
jgi:ABC-type nitrate/sulfonate/bicarbonate transport system substrate-binding protein/outer membrane protein OmpA-like peptidoglycan-associated protein